VVAFALPAGLSAADPVVWRTDYTAARKEAEEKKRPLLVVIGTEQCVYCRKMESATFADPAAAAVISERFVPLKIDAHKESEFARAMRVTVYPTTVIAGPDGKVYAYLSGFVGPDQFREHAEKAVSLIPASPPEKTATAVTKPAAAAVRAVGPADSPRPVQSAKELLQAARAAFQADRYGECLELCEAISGGYVGSGEADAAGALAVVIRSEPDKLAAAGEQLDERFAAAYYRLAEAWAKQGRGREAIGYYEKAVRAAPAGKYADLAQARLTTLYREFPEIKAVR
jgi:tetratricopeptide (TPR) repeat protein